MIDFSPEAWDRHRRGEFPEGGGAPAAYLPQGGGSWGGRALPDTLSYSVSSASVSSLSSDRGHAVLLGCVKGQGWSRLRGDVLRFVLDIEVRFTNKVKTSRKWFEKQNKGLS